MLVGQRAAVIASCIGFAYVLLQRPSSKLILYAVTSILVLLGCVEKLCSIMNMVAIERDWVGFAFLRPDMAEFMVR